MYISAYDVQPPCLLRPQATGEATNFDRQLAVCFSFFFRAPYPVPLARPQAHDTDKQQLPAAAARVHDCARGKRTLSLLSPMLFDSFHLI